MNKIKELFQKYREFIVYVIVGCCTTAINLGVYTVLRLLFGNGNISIGIATTIAWIISVTFAFFMNKLVVFGSKSTSTSTLLVEAGEFYGARVFSLLLELGGLLVLNTLLGLKSLQFHFIIDITGDWISKFIMLVIVTVCNYLFSKFIIFKSEN